MVNLKANREVQCPGQDLASQRTVNFVDSDQQPFIESPILVQATAIVQAPPNINDISGLQGSRSPLAIPPDRLVPPVLPAHGHQLPGRQPDPRGRGDAAVPAGGQQEGGRGQEPPEGGAADRGGDAGYVHHKHGGQGASDPWFW